MSLVFSLLMFITSLLSFEGLEVVEVRNSHAPYENFCRDFSKECDLEHSSSIIEDKENMLKVLNLVNERINRDLKFSLDSENYGVEEKWSLPLSGEGDCEDNALLKRKVLVEEFGFPRGSLRMATAFHKDKFYAHALLAVNTSKGVFILDQDQEKVLFWKDSPYIFEAWEIPGRKWERFAQDW